MAMKIKGIYKISFKFISQIFVVKEREMEIGYPTDVKHVAHIGYDNSSITAPTWMSEFRTSPNFATSFGNIREPRVTNPMPLTTWSHEDMEEAVISKATSMNNACKKKRAEKPSQHLSPRSSSSSSSWSSTRRSSRGPKSKLTFVLPQLLV